MHLIIITVLCVQAVVILSPLPFLYSYSNLNITCITTITWSVHNGLPTDWNSFHVQCTWHMETKEKRQDTC